MTGEHPIKFWSFSALKTFEKCPYEIYLKRVERLPRPEFPENHPLSRGIRVHQEAEDFVKGVGDLTTDLRRHRDRLLELREAFAAGNAEAEDSWWFNADWTPVSHENPDRTVVIIVDAAEHISDEFIRITDWKTGKSFGKEIKYGEQTQLYALAGFMRYPKAKIIETELIYLDENKDPVRRTFDRTRVPPLLARWEQRAARLLSATAFPAKPNKSNCRYCDYGPNNGGSGACPYGVEL